MNSITSWRGKTESNTMSPNKWVSGFRLTLRTKLVSQDFKYARGVRRHCRRSETIDVMGKYDIIEEKILKNP